MIRFLYKREFLKRFDKCEESEQKLVIAADAQIRLFCVQKTAPYGLRIKKLFEKGGVRIFESRVSDKMRLLFIVSENRVAFAFLGNHDQVRRYIKSFR